MDITLRRCSSISSIAAVLLAAVALTVTGCSIDTTPIAASVDSSAAVAGIVHGGPIPVSGATVTLYATQSNGYGGTGKALATATTNSGGVFTFSTSYTCPVGQQAYIVSAAGNTSGNTTNANAVLMAAIGPCSGLSSSTDVLINEPSTVAAAYALGNFMSISGTGGSTVVNISAPANNNATSGSCTVTSGVTTSCVAAGLAHAFLNAKNLVNAVGTTSALPTGQVYATPPSNSTASISSATTPALINQVPQQEINSLADSVEACVNTKGLTGTGDTTSACGQLFTAATVSASYTSNPTYTTEPTNTLQALVNLAKFPFISQNGTTGLSSTIYGIGAANSYYQPTLTAAPADWSIAIIWRSYASGANEVGPVYYTTTDINDNVYATALTDPNAGAGSASGAAPFVAQALTSNGAGIWSSPATISTNTTNVCNIYGGTALLDPPCEAATDTLGNLWVANGSANTGESGGVYTSGYIAQVSTSTGAVTQFTIPSSSDYPMAVAVDKSNDVFFSTGNNSGANLWKFPQGSTSTTAPTAVTFGGTAYASSHTLGSIAFDTLGDIFGSHNAGGGIGYSYGPEVGTFPAESFGTLVDCNYCSGAGLNEGINSEPSSALVDASGNFWFEGNTGLMEMTASGVASETGANNYTLGTSSQTMRQASMDGAGTIFVPDSNAGGSDNPLAPPKTTGQVLRIFYPAFPTQLNVAIVGCNVGTATGNTACITANAGAPNNLLFFQADNAAVDSTGSLWVSSPGNDAVIQVIGTAAPTWPQVSYIHPAVMPQ